MATRYFNYLYYADTYSGPLRIREEFFGNPYITVYGLYYCDNNGVLMLYEAVR